MKKNGFCNQWIFTPKNIISIFFLIIIFICFCGCPPAETPGAGDGDSASGEDGPATAVDWILDDLAKRYPDFPIHEKSDFPPPDALDEWDSEEDKQEILDIIDTGNAIMHSPFINTTGIRTGFPSPPAANAVEPNCYTTTPGSTTCIYTYTENDGLLNVIWTDTRMVSESEGITVWTWIVQIAYDGIDYDGTEYDNDLVQHTQEITTDYPTGLIDYESVSSSFCKKTDCGLMKWAEVGFKYDAVNQKHETYSLINECDTFAPIPVHLNMKHTCEWPDPDELFDQPVYHHMDYLWDYNVDEEYLWIDYSINMNTMAWDYTVYNPDGSVAAEGSS